MGEGEDTKATTPQTTVQTLNEELKNPSRVQSCQVPFEPACLWSTWLLSLWTA